MALSPDEMTRIMMNRLTTEEDLDIRDAFNRKAGRLGKIKYEIRRVKAPLYTMGKVTPKPMRPYTAKVEVVRKNWTFDAILKWIEERTCSTL